MQKLFYQKWWFWLITLGVGGLIAYLLLKPQAPQAKQKLWSYQDPTTGQVKQIMFAPEPFTEALYNAIYDNSVFLSLGFYRDETAFENFLKLGDAEFVAVCTDWNNRHKKADNETLRQAVFGEYLSGDLNRKLETRFTSLSII